MSEKTIQVKTRHSSARASRATTRGTRVFACPVARGGADRGGVRRGVSADQVCVLSGVNDKGDCFFDVACRGRLTSKAALALLSGRVGEGAIVSTDRLASYVGVLGELKVAVHRRVDAKDRRAGTINIVNSLHSRLKSFIARFRGVATRRLHNYLVWFKWAEMSKRLGGRNDAEALMANQVGKGSYRTTWRGYRDTPYPFMDYWEKSNAI